MEVKDDMIFSICYILKIDDKDLNILYTSSRLFDPLFFSFLFFCFVLLLPIVIIFLFNRLNLIQQYAAMHSFSIPVEWVGHYYQYFFPFFFLLRYLCLCNMTYDVWADGRGMDEHIDFNFANLHTY